MRPERVLQKGEKQVVLCRCGATYDVEHDVRMGQCPKCGEASNWNLRK